MSADSIAENPSFVAQNGIIARTPDTNAVLFVRFELKRPSVGDRALLKTDHFGVACVPGRFCCVSVIRDVKHIRVYTIQEKELQPPKIIDDCPMHYSVAVRAGETESAAEPVELFYFPALPSALAEKRPRVEFFQQTIQNFHQCEKQQSEQKSASMQKAQLEATPARLWFEADGIDHYKNWQEVGTKLLSKEWLCFFAANEKLLAAKIDSDIKRLRVEVWKAYIIDHKVLFGTLPKLGESDAAELLADDEFLRTLTKAMDTPLSPVDKVTWQIFNGWLARGYYQMNESAFEEAFNRDYQYEKKIKGHTLAVRADRIGLISALRTGPRKINGPAG